MRFTIACIAALVATPCAAQVRTVVEPLAPGASDGSVFFLNEGERPIDMEPPATIEAVRRGSGDTVTLRAPAGARLTLEPGGFARIVYAAPLAEAEPQGRAVAADRADAGADARAEAPHTAGPTAGPSSSGGTAAGGLIERFEAYEPVYVIAGDLEDATKLQFSFAFRFFDAGGGGALRFGYTQTMFWATGAPSWPFTSTIYSPSLYHTLLVSRGRIPMDVSVGYAHDSSGEAGRRSRDVNRVFVRAAADVPLGGDWTLTIAPSLWHYIDWPADRPPGIEDYRGHTSLELAIGERGGPRLSSRLRGLETGRGSAELNGSLPMRRIWSRLPALHLFGQLFTGFGETLIDYDREATRFRFGIAFVR
ncbi:MAG TPA: phospholipase A [Allosphingosinicella sp.]|jgi:outer membrane phospholipase A